MIILLHFHLYSKKQSIIAHELLNPQEKKTQPNPDSPVTAGNKVEIQFFCLASPLIHVREAPHSVVEDTELIPLLVAADAKRHESVPCKQILRELCEFLQWPKLQ